MKFTEKDKEIRKLKRTNNYLRKLIIEGVVLLDAFNKDNKHWKDMYNQLNRICEREGI